MKHGTLVGALLLGAAAHAAEAQAKDPAKSRAAFVTVARVLRDARCMNCHTVTNFPRQGDDRHRHQQLVMRGPGDQGAVTLKCSACHGERNSWDGRVPGAPHWQLAPLSMAWEGLDDAQLCRAVLALDKNGQRDGAKLAQHMLHDPLVQWAWSPGLRRAAAVPQAEFHAAVQDWIGFGPACPE